MVSTKIMRVRAQDLLRRTGTLGLAERVRFRAKVRATRANNEVFQRHNPGFAVPPESLAFDAYSAPDWAFYHESGLGTAGFLAGLAHEYCRPTGAWLNVYEWGCGPGRVIRHMPSTLGADARIFGSDYNADTISWCSRHLPGITFATNGLQPPLPYEDDSFHFAYSISVFTHLAEATGLSWTTELHRVMKPGGILVVTTSGDSAFESEMLPRERDEYVRTGVVVRGDYAEGKKMFLTRHSPAYVRTKLLAKFDIVEHRPAAFPFIAQDYWVARKPT